MVKTILLKYWVGAVVTGNYVYEDFATLEECYDFIKNIRIKEYLVYKLFGYRN